MARDMTVSLELSAEDRASAVLASFEGELGKLGDSTESLGGVLRRLGVNLEENVNKKLAANEKVLAAASKAYQEGRISASDYDRATLAIAKANDRLQASLKQTGDQVKASSGAFSLLGSFLKDHFAITLGDVSRAARGVANVVGSWVSAAAESEDGIKRLGNALADLGPKSAAVRDALVAQAEALQKVTKYEDDAIIAGQAFAAGFIKSEDTLRRVTQAAVDLSAGLNLDLMTAFQLLTKASQGNTSTLSRYGLVIDETIPKSERFAAVLAIVNERFGGRAAADAATYAGEVTKLGNAFGDLEEAIGGAVTGSTAATQTVRDLTAVVSGAAAATEAASESEGAWAGALRTTMEVIVRASGPLGNIVANYRALQNARAEAAAAASKEAKEEAALMNQKAAFAREMIQLLNEEAAAHDVNRAAQIRANRIEADALATKDVLIEAARNLGITLSSETAAGIEKARLEVEALEDAWRRGVTTADGFRVSAEDVARAHAALADLIAGKATDAVRTHTDAVTDGTTEAGKYATILRGTLGPALDDIAARADNAARGIQGLVDRSGAAITGVKAIVQGGRVAELIGGGSRLVGTGGTFGSQQRVSDATSKTYIYNPQSGRVEQIG